MPFSQKSSLYSTLRPFIGFPLWSELQYNLPTHNPVSPSYNHPWNGQEMHCLLTTFPPIPRLAPRCLQYASNIKAFPVYVDLKTTKFYPAISTAKDSPLITS